MCGTCHREVDYGDDCGKADCRPVPSCTVAGVGGGTQAVRARCASVLLAASAVHRMHGYTRQPPQSRHLLPPHRRCNCTAARANRMLCAWPAAARVFEGLLPATSASGASPLRRKSVPVVWCEDIVTRGGLL